jgi:hypothetical protein
MPTAQGVTMDGKTASMWSRLALASRQDPMKPARDISRLIEIMAALRTP